MKINIPHFLPYPETPIMTRQERLYQRQVWEKDLKMMKYYGAFIAWLFLLCFIVSIFNGKSEMDTLHGKICSEAPGSILCTSRDTLEMFGRKSREKWVPLGLVVGVAYAESSLHTNYNKPICKEYNNLFGLKGYKRDDGRLDWYTDNRGRPDDQGCWLYKFKSIEEWLNGFLNTISMGYKGCKNDVRCISYAYVGDPNKSEESWISRVKKFY